MKKRTFVQTTAVLLLVMMFAVSCSAEPEITAQGNNPDKRAETHMVSAQVEAIQAGGVAESNQRDTHNAVDTNFEDQVSPEITYDEQTSGVIQLQNSFNSVVKAVLPAVVELKVTSIQARPRMTFEGWPWFFDSQPDEEEYESNSLGSGVIFRRVGDTYYVLTNHHVAGEATKIQIVTDDERTYEAELVGTDERRDLSVVTFESEERDITIARLGDSDQLEVGDWVLAMGSPFGYVSSVTSGIVSALGRSGQAIDNINDFIQTDAAINSGNSGGPLVDIHGNVIGINTWIAAPSGGSIGLGFAIPINNAKDIIDELIEFGKAVDGWLGISMLDMSSYAALVTSETDDDATGVFVANVYLNSPAYKGGIRPGDIITGFNGQRELALEELSRMISNAPLDVAQLFTVERDGEEYEFEVTLEQRKSETEIAEDAEQLWPGIIPVELNEEILSSLSLSKSQEGVMIQFMTTDMEMNKFRNAGMKNYDIITHINGNAITSVTDFYEVIADDGITYYYIDYIRNGRTYSTGVRK
jgi:Do/DeqQ family serine protease